MKKTISEGPGGLLDFYILPDCTPAPTQAPATACPCPQPSSLCSQHYDWVTPGKTNYSRLKYVRQRQTNHEPCFVLWGMRVRTP